MWCKLANVFLLGCAISLHAQTWETLRGLRAGDRVYVLDSAGKQHKGTFSSLSDEALSISAGKTQVSIERARVRRVDIPSSSRRIRNALIGAGVGFAVGLATDLTLGAYLRNESGESGGARALTYILPIALVGGVAAAVPGHKTIYRSR
jgi:hypothetical protein